MKLKINYNTDGWLMRNDFHGNDMDDRYGTITSNSGKTYNRLALDALNRLLNNPDTLRRCIGGVSAAQFTRKRLDMAAKNREASRRWRAKQKQQSRAK